MTKSYSSYRELCFLLSMSVYEARKLKMTLSDLRMMLWLDTRDNPEILNEQARELIYN